MIGADEIAAIVAERDRLRVRVTGLLHANNRLVLERREARAEADYHLSCATAAEEVARMNAVSGASWALAADECERLRAEADRLRNGLFEMAGLVEAETARAVRAEAVVQSIIREGEGDRESSYDVRDVFAGEVMRARNAPRGEWAFGPWVSVKSGDPAAPGFYQRRYEGGPDFSSFDPEERFGGMFYAAMEVRRAYRVGEWHDFKAGDPCPLADGEPFEADWSERGADFKGRGPMVPWHLVRRFRPLGKAVSA